MERRLVYLSAGVSALVLGACALPASTSPPPSAAADCSQEVFDRGAGWKEVGGPRAFVLAYPVVADPVHPYKVFVRFEQDLEPPFTVEARMRDGQLHEKGWFNDEIERGEWAEGDGPPMNVAGSVHLVILLFPRPGCWEVTLSAGSEVAGMALVEVRERPEPVSTPVTFKSSLAAGSAAPP